MKFFRSKQANTRKSRGNNPMNEHDSDTIPGSLDEARRGARKGLIQVLVILILTMALLFASAGDIRWPMGWLYFGIYLLARIISSALLMRKSPEVLAERSQIKAGSQSWDKLPALIVGLVGPLAMLLVAGLDRRFGWSPQLAFHTLIGASIFVALGCAIGGWAINCNKFFSAVVRIQSERDHSVASDGPYGIVRHPGYTGMAIYMVAAPLMLGSIWGLIPAGLTILVLIYRTAREDRFLHAKLDGYRDYAGRTRHRLLPGIW